MGCARFRREFRVGNCGFYCEQEEAESFYVSQWCKNRNVFLAYRAVMALNALAWTIAYYPFCKYHCPSQYEHSYQYMTLWADFLRTNYFIWGLILLLIKLKSQQQETGTDVLKRLRSLVWLLHGVSISSNGCVALLYWPAVVPDMKFEIATNVINVYLHFVNYLLLLFDLSVAAFPIRLFHGVYSSLLVIVYGLFTYILWRSGGTNAVYAFLDWENAPGFAIVFFITLTFVAAPIMQVVTFSMYLLRQWCHRKCFQDVKRHDHPESYNLRDNFEED